MMLQQFQKYILTDLMFIVLRSGQKFYQLTTRPKILRILKQATWWHTWTWKQKEIKSAKIEKLEKVIHHGLVRYKFESGIEITATQDHPFRIENKGWASLKPDKSKQYKGFENIEKIYIGDLFLTEKGTDKLISIDFLEGEQETYTISRLRYGDNFIANGLIVGIEELNY